MQDAKALLANISLVSDTACDDLFEALVSQISALPPEKRGIEALRLTSCLLEFAAFELAETLGSEKAGAMIECAAQLSRQTDINNAQITNGARERRRIIQ